MIDVLGFIYVLLGCGLAIYVSGARWRSGEIIYDPPPWKTVQRVVFGFCVGSAILMASFALA